MPGFPPSNEVNLFVLFYCFKSLSNQPWLKPNLAPFFQCFSVFSVLHLHLLVHLMIFRVSDLSRIFVLLDLLAWRRSPRQLFCGQLKGFILQANYGYRSHRWIVLGKKTKTKQKTNCYNPSTLNCHLKR